MPSIELSNHQKRALLKLARASIEMGPSPAPERRSSLTQSIAEDLPELASANRCCFVSLHCRGELRGCIGALEPYQDLLTDIVEHAQAAAFHDPRFPPLRPEEYDSIRISISVLSETEPMDVKDEADLLGQLRPGVDGLALELKVSGEHTKRSTFLPVVWQQLPEPKDFLVALKHKAGLASDYWSRHLAFSRYSTLSFEESVA